MVLYPNFNRAGTWIAQLVRGDQPIGEPFEIEVIDPATNWLDWLRANWRLVSGWAFGGSLAAATLWSGVILLVSGRTSGLINRMNDTLLAKQAAGAHFALRNIPSLHPWVLRPWFAAMAREERKGADEREANYWDTSVTSQATGASLDASQMLDLLKGNPRLWLRGPSGMGKSSIFDKWERIYFASDDAGSLRQAAARHGFIFMPLQVRNSGVAGDAAKTAKAIVEDVRAKLAAFGFHMTEASGVVEGMLRGGRIAIGLDGANERDRNDAIRDFAAKYPQTRIIVTSQDVPPTQLSGEAWQVWDLPQSVAGIREDLLRRWLGDEARAKAVNEEIETSGLGANVVSGYDVRLIADLELRSGGDRTTLPGDRITLYDMMLKQAAHVLSAPSAGSLTAPSQYVDALQKAAWDMISNGSNRREFTPQERASLGEGNIAELAGVKLNLLRLSKGNYEFRHDLMRLYFAASWLAERSSVDEIWRQLKTAKISGLNVTEFPNFIDFLIRLLDRSGQNDVKILLNLIESEDDQEIGQLYSYWPKKISKTLGYNRNGTRTKKQPDLAL
jgi:hypothetical protein